MLIGEEDISKLHPDLLLYKAAAAHNLPVMCEAFALGADKLWTNVEDRSRSAIHQAVISVSLVTKCIEPDASCKINFLLTESSFGLQEPVSGSCPEPHESSPHCRSIPLQEPFLVLLSPLCLALLLSGSHTKCLYAFVISHPASNPALLIQTVKLLCRVLYLNECCHAATIMSII